MEFLRRSPFDQDFDTDKGMAELCDFIDYEGMNMYELNERDLLTRVTTYELNREDGSIRIDVHEVVAGEFKMKFFAVPNLIIKQGEREFIGIGGTAEEALEDCLSRVKGASVEKIIPAPLCEV